MNAISISWRIGLAAVVATVIAATSPGAARACTPTYDPFGALVGCCKADGTPMNDGATCVDPNNPCAKNKCTAPSGSTAGTCNKASYTSTAGHPKCLLSTDRCSVGECYNQGCAPIDNQAANGYDFFCDDGEDCTNDSCDDDAATVLIAPICSTTNVAAATTCSTNPSAGTPAGECLVGECDGNGNCADEPAVDGTDCSGTASGGACQPRECDDGVCTNTGDPIYCEGTLALCRQWKCSWLSPTTHECTPVKVPKDTPCDTNDYDCKDRKCQSNGACGNQDEEVGHRCDPNHTSPVLADCLAGTCDARQDCVGEDQYNDEYNGMDCTDTNFCTTHSICVENANGQGGTCKATQSSDCAASTVDCPLCNVGNCNPAAGAPGCGCQ